jgi:hypothetical protein
LGAASQAASSGQACCEWEEFAVPYAVYLELVAPDHGADLIDPEKIPELITDLMHTGWEQPSVQLTGDDPDGDPGEVPQGPRSPLDGEVVGHPSGATVALALDTDTMEEALMVGVGLSRHLCDSAPATLGWQLQSLRADRLDEPYRPGQWLPDLD